MRKYRDMNSMSSSATTDLSGNCKAKNVKSKALLKGIARKYLLTSFYKVPKCVFLARFKSDQIVDLETGL
jgi:hypothetical protein